MLFCFITPQPTCSPFEPVLFLKSWNSFLNTSSAPTRPLPTAHCDKNSRVIRAAFFFLEAPEPDADESSQSHFLLFHPHLHPSSLSHFHPLLICDTLIPNIPFRMVWPIGFTCRWLGNLHRLKGLPPLPDALLTTALPPFIPPVLSIPSRDISWIAVSRCFKAHFALQRLLWKWIREHIPWEKSIFFSSVEAAPASEIDGSLWYQSPSPVFRQQKNLRQVISRHAENPCAHTHTRSTEAVECCCTMGRIMKPHLNLSAEQEV